MAIDIATKMTDDRMRALSKRLEGVYNEAYKKAVENEKEWIQKLASLPADAPEAKRKAFANEVIRRQKQTNIIASEIARAGETAADIVRGEMTGIFTLNYDYSAFSINRQTGLDLDWTLYDRNQLAVLVSEKEPPFTKIAYRNLGQSKPIVQRLQNHLIQSVMLGEGQPKIIKRIREVTGQSYRQARRVAQTERTRVQSQGRYMGYEEAENMGIGMQNRWMARLVRTRELHELTHMQVVDVGEEFSNGLKYPGDNTGSGSNAANIINCFCVSVPMVQTISPALRQHNAWAMSKSFERYQQEVEAKRAKGISIAERDYDASNNS